MIPGHGLRGTSFPSSSSHRNFVNMLTILFRSLDGSIDLLLGSFDA